jgi:hypothetical protein
MKLVFFLGGGVLAPCSFLLVSLDSLGSGYGPVTGCCEINLLLP